MSEGRVAATRSSLVRLRRRLEQVQKGAALLRRKRESLVRELFDRARPAVEERREIERQAVTAHAALLAAQGSAGVAALAALARPERHVEVDLVAVEAWGLHAVELERFPGLVRGPSARGSAPGSGDGVIHEAGQEMERLLELVLRAAPREMLLRRLGEALSRTTRLVNTLEQRVATGLSRDLAMLRRTLEEREREENLRLKRLIGSRRTR